MASYYLRSKDGILKALLPGRVAGRLVDDSNGFFRKANYTNGETKTVFEITDGRVVEVAGVRVYLWEGDTLVPENSSLVRRMINHAKV